MSSDILVELVVTFFQHPVGIVSRSIWLLEGSDVI